MSQGRGTSPVDIEIKHVEYFLMLAEHGSISRAAKSLGLAQPSLSEQIARLEARLNTKLAIRGPRGITLTEAGSLLVRDGPRLVEAARALTNSVRELAQDPQGTVSVGLPPSLSMLIGVPLAETLQIEAPGIKMHLSEGLSGHVLDWIESERLDLGFVYSPPTSATFQSDPILAEEIFIVAAEDNLPMPPNADGIYSINASELGSLPLVMPSQPHSARVAIERFAHANDIHLNVVIEIDSLSQIIEMVSRASAYAVLPHVAVTKAVQSGRLVLVRIENPTFNRIAYLTRKRGRSVSMASLRVEHAILQVIQEMCSRYELHADYLGDPNSIRFP